MHQTVARARFHTKVVKKLARSEPQKVYTVDGGRFGPTLLLCGFAPGCDEALARLRAGKHQ